MGRKPYRVEINYPKNRKPQYYLVKDVKVSGKKGKIKKYLGLKPPSAEEIEKLKSNLKKVVVPPKKTGQLRLTDFYL